MIKTATDIVIARIWLGSVIQAIRACNHGAKRSAIYFRYGPSKNDWYSGTH